MTRGAILTIGAVAYALLATYNYATIVRPMWQRQESLHAAPGIRVSVRHGVLLLSGQVADEPSRLLIRRAAEALFGPLNVADDLSFARQAPGSSLAAGAARAISHMRSEGWREPALTVTREFVILSGTTADEADQQTVLRAVEQALLGSRVESRIQVAPNGTPEGLHSQVQSALAARPIEFHQAGSVMLPETLAALDDIAALMHSAPYALLAIHAHVSTAPGGAEECQRLSQRRADAVRAYLIVRGVSAAQIIARGYGAAKPEDLPDSNVGRRLNDRVELYVQSTSP
ncbi:MAG: OmpA family protein [Bryobacterales bacterium]|nr:OmpA family protein [Bryobacterales bacterium]